MNKSALLLVGAQNNVFLSFPSFTEIESRELDGEGKEQEKVQAEARKVLQEKQNKGDWHNGVGVTGLLNPKLHSIKIMFYSVLVLVFFLFFFSFYNINGNKNDRQTPFPNSVSA